MNTVGYNDFIKFVRDGDQLIHDIQFSTMESDDFITFAGRAMQNKVSDLETFQEALNYRNHLQGFLITDSTIAIPHIVHESIHTAAIILVHNKNGVELKNMDGVMSIAHYLVYMFLPEDTLLRPLISEMSLLVMEYIDSPEKLFSDDNFVIEYMKQAFLKQISRQIKTME